MIMQVNIPISKSPVLKIPEKIPVPVQGLEEGQETPEEERLREIIRIFKEKYR